MMVEGSSPDTILQKMQSLSAIEREAYFEPVCGVRPQARMILGTLMTVVGSS
jgi:hypothetical protein